jgi:hypothetical protein
MISEVKYASMDESNVMKAMEVIGLHYNDPPVGLTEITPEEFANSHFFSYLPLYIDHKQILLEHKDGKSYYTSIYLYHYHDGAGIGIIRDSHTKHPRYYRYGCKHNYRSMTIRELREKQIPHFGNCYHVDVCTECGHVNAYDSSD